MATGPCLGPQGLGYHTFDLPRFWAFTTKCVFCHKLVSSLNINTLKCLAAATGSDDQYETEIILGLASTQRVGETEMGNGSELPASSHLTGPPHKTSVATTSTTTPIRDWSLIGQMHQNWSLVLEVDW